MNSLQCSLLISFTRVPSLRKRASTNSNAAALFPVPQVPSLENEHLQTLIHTPYFLHCGFPPSENEYRTRGEGNKAAALEAILIK